MNHTILSSFRPSASLALLLATALGLQAQTTFTWDGGGADDFWTNGSNWVGDAAPTPATNNALLFGGTTRLTNENSFGAGTGFFALEFGSSSGNFTLGGNALTLGDGGGNSTNLVVRNGGTKTFDLALNINEAASTFQGSGSPTVIFNGLVTMNSSSNNPLVLSGGVWEFKNTNNSFNQILRVDSQTTLRTSQLIDSGSNSTIGVRSFIQLGNAAGSGFLDYTGGATSTDRQIRIGGGASNNFNGGGTISNNGTGAIIFANATFNNSSATEAVRTLTLGGTFTNGTNVIQGQIVNNSNGATAVNMTVNGSIWEFAASNSYTGVTTVASNGNLIVSHAHALGATSGVVTVNGSGSLGLRGGITTAAGQNITLNGNGLNATLGGRCATWRATTRFRAM